MMIRVRCAVSRAARKPSRAQQTAARGAMQPLLHCQAIVRPAQPISVRQFASSTGTSSSSAAYDLLKLDFRRWLGKEVQLLVALTIVGVSGVYFYQNREGAPSRQIAKFLDAARENAKKEDREAALKNCLQAYSIVKTTNAQDRHLFELAFLVAAQFETLGKVRQATKYYLEALGSLPYVRDLKEQDIGRVVVLDRLAQCYQDQGEQRAAETYYHQAIESYDKRQRSTATEVEQIDREIPAVLFNYGQQLFHLKRWEDAKRVLHRAQTAAKVALVADEHLIRIDRLMSALQEADGQEVIETATDDAVQFKKNVTNKERKEWILSYR